VFGGRRAKVAPLVYETLSWQHGVFVGASVASETTAAQQGAAVGVVRRDPMSMLPFCGYNMADYFSHWLRMGQKIPKPPKIFHVNWFRRGADGKFMWPGFGDNMRVLLWILERVQGKGSAVDTPIGRIPSIDSINWDGLGMGEDAKKSLFSIDKAEWEKEIAGMEEFFKQFGDRLPKGIKDELAALRSRIQNKAAA
jgi:phosphoenolpyruvate carboxykinase (GTP)